MHVDPARPGRGTQAGRRRPVRSQHATSSAAGPVLPRLRPPGSKSMTNRALVLAALGRGPTTITGALRARDTELMAAALRALGASGDEGGADGDAAAWQVTPGRPGGRATIDVGNAGTVLRFVPPAAALARADVEF